MPNLRGASPVGRDEGSRSNAARTDGRVVLDGVVVTARGYLARRRRGSDDG